jgi:hypothetical protein
MAKQKLPGESNNQYEARRRKERADYLERPLPPPFEHRTGQWWSDVIDVVIGKTKGMK